MKLYISTGNSRMEKKWNGQEMEFSVFLERLSHTVRTSETMEQYRKMSKAKQDSIKDVGGFVLGKLKGGRRKKANVLFRSGLTLDMDYATEDIAEQIEMFPCIGRLPAFVETVERRVSAETDGRCLASVVYGGIGKNIRNRVPAGYIIIRHIRRTSCRSGSSWEGGDSD